MGRLLERAESLLLVVDAQPGFYGDAPGTEPHALRAALDRAAWLAAVATALDVPAVVTEEDAGRNGPTAGPILAVLPPGTTAHDKPAFGAADVPRILDAVTATDRRTAVIVGLETDVCVAQTALGLLDCGFRVAVVEDATFAPPGMHDAGIRRMAGAGVEVVHAKVVYYEWVRTLEAARRFVAEHPELADPPGFNL
jgi:nicotinamidase-related amidase